MLSVRTAGGWRQAGASVPLVEMESREPGQRPWWEQLAVESTLAGKEQGQANVLMKGRVGLKWRAEVELVLRAGSAVVDAELRLTALRSVALLGFRFLPLLAGEGSFGAAVSESVDAANGPAAHQAVRWGEITVGTVRRTDLGIGIAVTTNLPAAEGADYTLLGSGFRPERPRTMERGGMIRLRSRLFALYPSALVREAVTIAPPPAITIDRPHRTPK